MGRLCLLQRHTVVVKCRERVGGRQWVGRSQPPAGHQWPAAGITSDGRGWLYVHVHTTFYVAAPRVSFVCHIMTMGPAFTLEIRDPTAS